MDRPRALAVLVLALVVLSGVFTPTRSQDHIGVDLALNAVPPPATPVPISPVGIISASQPPFTWGASSGAEWYFLWVDDGDGNKVKTLYTAESAACPSGTGSCTVSPGVTLSGSGLWWIAAGNGGGQSAWSGGTSFTLRLSASVRSLLPVTGATTGSTSRLSAFVLNNGSVPFPAGAKVWFRLVGPDWVAGQRTQWIGSADVEGLAPGAYTWYFFDWAIPITAAPGWYFYWARVYAGDPISALSYGLPFQVNGPSTAAPILYPVNGGSVAAGATALLWARVTNTGPLTLPAGAKVWFYVDGPGWMGDHWVGATLVEGLAIGATQWYSFTLPVPMAATSGTYTYWARVYSNGAISPLSAGMTFTVTP